MKKLSRLALGSISVLVWFTLIFLSPPVFAEDTDNGNIPTKSGELVFKLVARDGDAVAFLDQVDRILQANLSSFPELARLGSKYAETYENIDLELGDDSGAFKSLLMEVRGEYAVRFDDYEPMLNLLNSEEFLHLKPKGFDLALQNVDKAMRKAKDPVVLYVLEPTAEITVADLKNATLEIASSDLLDSRMAGKPYISLNFTSKGADRFANVTGDNIKERLAIVVDNTVYSAPVIQDRIPEGKAIITGQFTKDEARSLVNQINKKILSNIVN